ncbi:HepT-like ribonuclease domain-containing protein [Brevibacterium oceani]|uniref:HepT-like ribonuclease domain-containing protein n=1 Tax=Brevibacterium oceani TaxID=358099 RepID=UPI0015E7BADE|nr:HepT-like ribonuclease domain-containing protein [Brevibacterium oceani]
MNAMTGFVSGISDLESFAENLLVRSAVERQLELLGEALKKFRGAQPELADQVPNIHRIIGMRNVTAHEYGEIDYGFVWSTLRYEIPQLLPSIEEFLQTEGG